MNTLAVYDVPQRETRRRLEDVLRAHGFVWLCHNARWSPARNAGDANLVRAVRARLRGRAYRLLLLEVSQASRAGARWLVNLPERNA